MTGEKVRKEKKKKNANKTYEITTSTCAFLSVKSGFMMKKKEKKKKKYFIQQLIGIALENEKEKKI
jgi:hypothetical protein